MAYGLHRTALGPQEGSVTPLRLDTSFFFL